MGVPLYAYTMIYGKDILSVNIYVVTKIAVL